MSFVNYTMLIYSVFVLTIALSLFFAFVKINGKKFNVSFNILLAGTFITGCLVFYLINLSENTVGDGFWRFIKTFLITIHSTIGLFVIALEFAPIHKYVENIAGDAAVYFSVISAVVYVLSPILTFGVILSFFKNVSSYIKYVFSFFREIYVFSEMNQNSIALAKSIKENNKKAVICFNDVFAKTKKKNTKIYQALRKSMQYASKMIFFL